MFLIIKKYFFFIIVFLFIVFFTTINFPKAQNLKPLSVPPSKTTSLPAPPPASVPASPANPCLKDGVCKVDTTCTVSVAGVNKSSRSGECGFDPSNECFCEAYPTDDCDLANCSGKSCMATIFGRPYDGTCNKNGDTCSCIPGQSNR